MICRKVLICIVLQCCSAISAEGVAKKFPVIPRTGQVVTGSSDISSLSSFQQFRPTENLTKAIKTGLKFGKVGKIDGNTQQSRPLLIRIVNKNLSTAAAVSRKTFQAREDSGSNGRLLSNRTGWQNSGTSENQLNRSFTEKLNETIGNSDLEKPETERTPCTFIGKERDTEMNKEFLSFWGLASDSVNETDSLAAFHHTSTINRNCSIDQESSFCCEERAEVMDNFNNNDVENLCNTSQESTKCRRFCTDTDPDAAPFLNSTEYSCQRDMESSSKFTTLPQESAQYVVFSKANAIIFGEPENAKNPEFRFWTRQVLQNLNTALAQENRDANFTLSQQPANNSIILSQWIEFPEINETSGNQQTARQLLKDYQQYGENHSNNLIRICTANREDNDIACMEQHHHNMCLLDGPDGCADEMLSVEMSTSCRQFIVQFDQIMRFSHVPCKLLDEPSVIFQNALREASENAPAGIVLLQFTRTKVTHPIPITATKHDVGKTVNKKWQKHASGVKLKTEGRTGISQVKIIKVAFFEEATTIGSVVALQKSGYTAVATDSGRDSTSSDIIKNDVALEVTSKSETAAQRTTDRTSLPDSQASENFEQFDEISKNLANRTNSKRINEISVTARTELSTTIGFGRKNMNGKEKPGKTENKEQQPPLWEPFHMDCSIEQDEFNISSCSDWAAAGYCLSNNATRFLWCRKTCLCVGPPELGTISN